MATETSNNPELIAHDATASEAAPAAPDPATRLQRAKDVIQRNVYWAMGAGVLPLPLVDVLAISGVQLKLLRELSSIYGVSFADGVAKKAVMSLLVGIGGVGIGGVIGMSLAKLVPVVGMSLGVASVPVASGMLTHAVGNTFLMHFDAGGTLLDFDPEAMRRYFHKEYEAAKIEVTKLHEQGTTGTST